MGKVTNSRPPGGPVRVSTPFAARARRLATLGLALSLAHNPAMAGAGAQALAKPPELSKAEQATLGRLQKAIAPLTGTPLSADDGALIRDAFEAIRADKLDKAAELKSQVRDPVGAKLIEWYWLRSGNGEPQQYRDFLDANPAWPDRTRLTERLEEALFTKGGTSDAIKRQFARSGPDSGAGFAALASAYLAEGNAAEAKKYAARAWRSMSIPESLEAGFLARFAGSLTPADHKWRLDRLLIDTLRWDDEKKERAAIVRRVLPLLSAVERKKAEARLAVLLGAKGAKGIDALPAERDPDWGLVFHRIQALRRAEKIDEAAKLMLGAPVEEALIVNPDSWWDERRALAYEALRLGKRKLAYELVREAGPLSENPIKEQTFMAGWLALRFLKDTALAEPHFQAMLKAADGPLSRAKANYWLGRTAEARKDAAAAETYYRAAVADQDTFHGLLARQKLEPGRRSITFPGPTEPSADEITRFTSLDAVKAVVVAKRAGLDPWIMRTFIASLRYTLTSETEAAMLAQLAEDMGDTQSAVRTAKTAIGRGHNLIYYGYPIHTFPAYAPLRKPPEPAMLLGIARQETEFNTLTVSGAGAKGLLQVMTGTAKHVCRDYKIKCDVARLLKDPGYNAMLASAYVGDRMEDFAGSYVLTIAGYNAGPGRARQWIREFGDPRDPKVDPIDWIERIPIEETREYVGKVLSNVQIYRARLGEEDTALRLDEDLNRARGVTGGDPPAEREPEATASDG